MSPVVPIFRLSQSAYLCISVCPVSQHGISRMPDSQSEEPGFESTLLLFLSLGIFVLHWRLSPLEQLYKSVPGYKQWWKCEWIVSARNCSVARMLPREAELVLRWTDLSGEESVKRFEWANVLDAALYKNIPSLSHVCCSSLPTSSTCGNSSNPSCPSRPSQCTSTNR